MTYQEIESWINSKQKTEIACLELSSVYLSTYEQYNIAKDVVDKINSDKDYMEARLQIEIEMKPEKFGIKRKTENIKRHAVSLQPEIIKMKDKLLQAQGELCNWQRLLETLKVKQNMLTNLTMMETNKQ